MSRSRNSPVMADVAELAGVSSITVSRVINGHSLVTETTRAKVQAAIDTLGYRSNMAARTLAGGRSRVLGVISIETEFYGPSSVLFGIQGAARHSGHAIMFVTLRDASAEEMRAALDHLRDAHAEGVIVIAPVHQAFESLDVIRPTVPLVVTSGANDAHATVGIDQVRGARLATAHLLDLGHETVHHIRGPKGWLDAEARTEGWRQELRARKRRVPRALRGDWSPQSGYQAGEILAADPSVTAIFASNDQMALGLILALLAARRWVGKDVSVVGFDHTPESAFYAPPLTTIRQDLGDVGQRAVELLLEIMAGGENRHVSVEPSLVIRHSSGPMPRR
ncbi:MAG TPA: LacI family DNA-binding transcriptional regulator [Ilumatobacter sp.]|nr:LacI family DNA-binding transcriptional regulator [Ilumatobacter sp.]